MLSDHHDDQNTELHEAVGKRRKQSLVPLERDNDGHPRIPNFKDMIPRPTAGHMKKVLRAFFTYSYSKPLSLIIVISLHFHQGLLLKPHTVLCHGG